MLTFSEWAEEEPSNEKILGRSLPRQTYTIEVPFERPKLYPEHPKTLAEHFRKKRILSGLTQKGLAQLLDVKPCTIYNWERGVGPREKRLKARVAEFLGESDV